MSWIIGAIGAMLVAGAAYWKQSLTGSGALAAILMGTIYFGAGDLLWFGVLLVFFVTSSLLSKYKKTDKEELEKSYAKTGNRDAGQVLANGGIGMLLCLLHMLWPHMSWVYVYIGVMSTVTADTWATEIGSLSRRAPRSILTGKKMTAGTSGAVSLRGTLAAAGGGALVGSAGWLLGGNGIWEAEAWYAWFVTGLLSGLIGAFADSLLGATMQKMYRCESCGQQVEVKQHCGHETQLMPGWRWLDNDAVNMVSSIIGGLAAWAFMMLWH